MGLFTNYTFPTVQLQAGATLANADNNLRDYSSFLPNVFSYSTYNPFSYNIFSASSFMPILPNNYFSGLNKYMFNPFSALPPLNNQYTPLIFQPLSVQPLSANLSSSIGDTFERSVPTEPKTVTIPEKPSLSDLSKIVNNSKVNLSWWKAQGYNEEKGKELAAKTKKRSDNLQSRGIKSQCGRGVREGVNDAFYGGSVHHKPQNLNAKVFGDKYFSNDTNLKKINVEGMNLSKDDIPAGAIVIYEKYSGNPAGHIEVSDGNGHGYSDFTSTLLQNHGERREPKEIWIPV